MKRKRKVLLGSLSALLAVVLSFYCYFFCPFFVFSRQYHGEDMVAYSKKHSDWVFIRHDIPLNREYELNPMKGFSIVNIDISRYHEVDVNEKDRVERTLNGHIITVAFNNQTGNTITNVDVSLEQWLNGKWYRVQAPNLYFPVATYCLEDEGTVSYELINWSDVSLDFRDGYEWRVEKGAPFYGCFRATVFYYPNQFSNEQYSSRSDPFFIFPWGDYEDFSYEEQQS